MNDGKFFGKYRATVINPIDPLKKGRIQVQIPDLSNIIPSTWAMPCVPFAGIQSGVFVVPNKGAGVWVEFEHGDLDYPIWVGGYWGESAEIPIDAVAAPPTQQTIVIQSAGQYTIVISDVPGQGITLKSPGGLNRITINEQGISITGQSITLDAATINMNKGMLTVGV